MERAIRARRHRPVFMVDLAVPRDIEPEVGSMDDVFLYCIDDLAELVREGMDERQSAVVQAEAIIQTQVDSFLHWMQGRERVPLIRQLRESGEEARRAELDRALKALEHELRQYAADNDQPIQPATKTRRTRRGGDPHGTTEA